MTADPSARLPTFFDVVLNQRACRQFDGKPVDDDVLGRCLEAATHAPSAENKQPWVFVVVRDPDTRHQIVEMTRTAWRDGARSFSESRLTPALLNDVDRGVESGLASAPVIVVVCGDRSIGHEAVLPSSVFPATQNLLLAANAEGLGSALTTLATLRATELAELLELPDSVRPMAVVPLGWPARRLGPPRRLPLAERVHVDRFGRPWAT
ncbi:MAG TPA: nitroreductase family protein [Acidimicrobiales bacterium]